MGRKGNPLMRKFEGRRVERDATGRLLCQHCWNGFHWHYSKPDRNLIIDCEGGDCECVCIDHLNNPPAKIKRLKNNPDQMKIDVEPIQIGPESPAIHRDEN